jgi:hypothetical protein
MSVETPLLILRKNKHFKAGFLILLYDMDPLERLEKSNTLFQKKKVHLYAKIELRHLLNLTNIFGVYRT